MCFSQFAIIIALSIFAPHCHITFLQRHDAVAAAKQPMPQQVRIVFDERPLNSNDHYFYRATVSSRFLARKIPHFGGLGAQLSVFFGYHGALHLSRKTSPDWTLRTGEVAGTPSKR